MMPIKKKLIIISITIFLIIGLSFSSYSITSIKGGAVEVPATPAPSGGVYFAVSGSAKIVKVGVSPLTELSVLTYPAFSIFSTLAVDTVNGFLYASKFASASPVTIHKIRLSDFTEIATYTLPTCTVIYSAAIDTVNGYVYFGGQGCVLAQGQMVKIDLSTFTQSAILVFSGSHPAQFMSIDVPNDRLYTTHENPGLDGFVKLFKFNISGAGIGVPSSVNLAASELGGPVVQDPNADKVYELRRNTSTVNFQVVKFTKTTLARDATLTLDTNSSRGHGGTIDPTANVLYFVRGIGTSIKVYKVPTSSFTLISTLTMTNANAVLGFGIVIDSLNTFLYTLQPQPTPTTSLVREIRLSDFTNSDSLILSVNEVANQVYPNGVAIQ